MDVEIVFSGICSFVNLDGDDESIIGPSVILLKADDAHFPGGHDHPLPGCEHDEDRHHHHETDCKKGCEKKIDNQHIAFLAYDSRRVSVDDPDGFVDLPEAKSFQFLPLVNVQVKIADDDVGVPIVDASYSNVITREMYWPESKG